MLRILIAGLVFGALCAGCDSKYGQSSQASASSATLVVASPIAQTSPVPSATSNGTAVATATPTVVVNTTPISVRVVPTLRILSPKDGETITLPAEIRYQVTGFEVGDAPRGHMHAFVGDPASSYQVEIPLEGQTGVAYLSDDKAAFLPGYRNLTFQLANADHTLVSNPEAQVTIHNLTIEGRR